MTDNNDKPGHLARRFQQIAVAVFHAAVEDAGYDLTPVQYAALTTVGMQPGIDQATLAGLIAYDRTTITGVVDRLVQKGLVVRQATPSAWPRSNGPGFCSTMQVLMSGKADSCAARVNPAGPQPTMRTSTSAGTEPEDPAAGCRCDGSEISGSPGSNPFRWNCTKPPPCLSRVSGPAAADAAGPKKTFAEFDKHAYYQYTCQACNQEGFGDR